MEITGRAGILAQTHFTNFMQDSFKFEAVHRGLNKTSRRYDLYLPE